MKSKLLFVMLLATLTSKSLAAPVEISFSEFPPGSFIDTQYWEQGAIFVDTGDFPFPCFITNAFQDTFYAFPSPPSLRCNNPQDPPTDVLIVFRFMDNVVPGYLSTGNRVFAKNISFFVSSDQGATVRTFDTSDQQIESISVKAGLQQVVPRRNAHKISINRPFGARLSLDTLRFELIPKNPEPDPDKNAGSPQKDPPEDFQSGTPQDAVANAAPRIYGGACPVGNPCRPETGNKYQAETDYQGTKLGPSFTRYYNSALHKDMGLGFGWTSPLQTRLEFDSFSSSLVLYRRADGRGERFNCPRSGTCTPDADSLLTLTKDSSGYTVAHFQSVTERFDTTGHITTKTYPSGAVQTYAYDAQGRVASITGPFGHTLSFAYDGQGHLSTVTYPDGQRTSYGYVNGNLVQVNYPDGSSKSYLYENSSYPHQLTGITNENGVRYATFAYSATFSSLGEATLTQHAQTDNGAPQESFTFSYPSGTQTLVDDAIGSREQLDFSVNLGVKNLVQKTGPDGKILTQTFDANNNVLSRTDEEGRLFTYTYNSANQLLTMTEGSGTTASRTTTYTYLSSTVDLPTQIKRPSVIADSQHSSLVSITYDAQKNPTVITRSGFTPSGTAVSRSISFTYNASGQVTSVDGPRTDVSDVTTFTYYTCTTGGACGQLRTVTDALGHTTTFDSYDGAGRLLQKTDPNGLQTQYRYDLRGRLSQITETPAVGTARLTSYTYTPAGDVRSVTFPDGRTLTYDYDNARMLRKVTDNQGNFVSYKYDLKGNRTQEHTFDPTSTLVRQIDLSYDVRNRLASINAGGSLTQQIHDALGNLTSETDPNNNPATTHAYDALNRLTQTLDALGGTTSYGYTPHDDLARVTAPNNATTQYVYDDLGNLLQEISPDRGTTSYTYDAAGNVLSKTDARGITVNYSYDALNRVTRVDYPGTAEDITYTYDSGTNCTNGVGRLCQVTDASGTTQYGYDAFGNITQEQKTELGTVYTTTYTYDAGNRIASLNAPGGRVISYTRDVLGRIATVSATVNGSSQTIVSGRTYRPDGLLLSQSYGNGLSETRQYDLQGRLTNQFIGSADTRVYGYDANSNLTSLQSLPQVGAYSYDALDRLMQDSITSSPSSTVNLTYDPNGNRTSDGTNTYTYTTNTNRLSQVGSSTITLDAAGNITNDGTQTYNYNNDGHLQSVALGTTTLGSYLYNYERQRTEKTTSSARTVYHYDVNGNLILETGTDGTSQISYVYADNIPIAQINRSGGVETITYLHTDHEGTPRLGTDNTQTVVWTWAGRAFGDTQPTGTATVNLRFPGMYADAESGLYYNWNRYYDPKSGRYATADPIGLKGGVNTYLYAKANPLRFVDGTGLSTMVLPWELPLIRPAPLPYTLDPALPVPIPIQPEGTTTEICRFKFSKEDQNGRLKCVYQCGITGEQEFEPDETDVYLRPQCSGKPISRPVGQLARCN
ncbi:MAG: RHS repeat-associated core domain-containing protein [Sulfurifustis sp.]